MWLYLPEGIEHVLWEGALEPETKEVDEQLERDGAAEGPQISISEAVRIMPVVSIGQPETWHIRDVYPLKKLPRPLLTKVNEADFYLVRLSCSFRPIPQESRIRWARFRVSLLRDSSKGLQPIAYDLYPQEIRQEVKRQVKVTLSPTLKFWEVEVSGSVFEFGLEFQELRPLITGLIGGGQDPSWDYAEAQGVEVQGTKWMYLMIKAPKGMLAGQAILDLAADVQLRGMRLPVVALRNRKQAEAHLTVRLWG